MNSDQIIELHVKVHCAVLSASGAPVTEAAKQIFRESLQSLVKLARIEYAQGVALDMEQALSALRE